MIDIEEARKTLGTLGYRLNDQQIGSVLYNVRFISNRIIDNSLYPQNIGTVGTATP